MFIFIKDNAIPPTPLIKGGKGGFWRALDPGWRFALVLFLAARIALSAWAFAISALIPLAVSNLYLHGEPVVAAFDLRTSTRAVFSRMLDGNELHFRAAYPNLLDVETNTVWDLSGRAVSGKRAGANLQVSKYTVEDVFPYRGVAAEQNALLAPWQRFDANWYVAIAERGYGTISGDIHFPPLYPLLIRILGWVVADRFTAGVLISNLAFIAALALLHKIVAPRFGTEVARRAVAYLVIFPTAFFFLSAYTEGVYLVLVLLSLFALEREQWLWAGFAIFCAILIRLQGIALLVPFAYAAWQARKNPLRPPLVRGAGGIAGALIALAALGVYLLLRIATGEPTVVPTSEPNLFARLAPPWENYFYAAQTLLSGKFLIADALNFAVTTLCILILILGWKQMPLAWNLYSVASLIIVTARLVDSQPLNSMSRYALTLFPVFVWLALQGRSAWAQRVIVYLSVPLQLFLSAQFFLWGWVA